jgi:hypothetical protein
MVVVDSCLVIKFVECWGKGTVRESRRKATSAVGTLKATTKQWLSTTVDNEVYEYVW